jgi:hypothetical protein
VEEGKKERKNLEALPQYAPKLAARFCKQRDEEPSMASDSGCCDELPLGHLDGRLQGRVQAGVPSTIGNLTRTNQSKAKFHQPNPVGDIGGGDQGFVARS